MMFGIAGWPSNQMHFDRKAATIHAKWFHCLALEVLDTVYAAMGRPRDHALALVWDKHTIHREGQTSRPPGLRGVSGAGMWRMNSRRAPLIVGRRDPLVAIFNEVTRGKPDALTGTRIVHHLNLIRVAWPDMAPYLPASVGSMPSITVRVADTAKNAAIKP